MPKDYPDSITWMIEVRDWPDDENPVPTPDRPEVPEWMKYAPEQVTSFGTGVVIRLEQLTPEDKPMNPPQIKNYLLTCGHVVRVGESGFGRVAKEIVCWHPEYGYQRTRRFDLTMYQGRLKGIMEGGYAAKVSSLSPYEGRLDAIPEKERKKHRDWILLEVADVPMRNPIETEQSARAVKRTLPGDETMVVGYPAGAGWVKQEEKWLAGAHMLEDGEMPSAKRSDEHAVANVSNGMISYHEAVDARPGMSGGGVFLIIDWSLAGLHRSRDDGAMEAEAICVADILEWLRTHRHMRPVFPPKGQTVHGGRWAAVIAVLIAVVGLLILLSECGIRQGSVTEPPPVVPETVNYHWRGIVVEEINGHAKPVEGVTVRVVAGNVPDDDLHAVTDGNGYYDISTQNPAFTTGDIKLRLQKAGYESSPDFERHAVSDETYRPNLTIKPLTPPP